MLIHPWDEATRAEWRDVLAAHDFGQLITAGHVAGFPVVVPTHFHYDGDAEVWLHLARPNPVWTALEADQRAVLSVIADWAYVEAAWNAGPGDDPAFGVPTSYYTAVQLLGTAEIVDDPGEKLRILAAQLARFEPAGSARTSPTEGADRDLRLLPGLRGIRFRIESVRAKQKYGGNKPPDQRRAIAERLDHRAAPGDAAARAHLLRRTDP